jgi:hypothetical protein
MKKIIILLSVGILFISTETIAKNKSYLYVKTDINNILITSNVNVGSPHVNCSPNYGMHGELTWTNVNFRTITKVKVRYRNVTDNKRWNTRRFDYNGNWRISNLDPNKEYSIKVYYKTGGWLSSYKFAHEFNEWSACNTTSFTINGVADTDFNICGEEPIIMNGSASTQESGYIISMREVNSSLQSLGSEVLKHFSGAVPSNINIRNFAQSNGIFLQGEKKYHFKLVTKPRWVEKNVILHFKPAIVDFKPNARLESGTTNRYISCVGRNGLNLWLNTQGSSCTSRYFIEMSEVDQNFNNVSGTNLSKWITPFTSLPNVLNVSNIYTNAGYNFQIGKYYRIKLAVGFPWHSKEVFVKFIPLLQCPLINNVGKTRRF